MGNTPTTTPNNNPAVQTKTSTPASLPGTNALEADQEAKRAFMKEQRTGIDQLNSQLSEGGKSAFRAIQASLKATGNLPTPEQLKAALAGDVKTLNLGSSASLNDKDIALLMQAVEKSYILQKPESLKVVHNPNGSVGVVGTPLVPAAQLGSYLNGVKGQLQIAPNERDQQAIASANAVNHAVDQFRAIRSPNNPNAPVVVSEATSVVFNEIKAQQAAGKYDGAALAASLEKIKGMQPIPAAEAKVLKELVAGLPYGAEVRAGFDTKLATVNTANEQKFKQGSLALLQENVVQINAASGSQFSIQGSHILQQSVDPSGRSVLSVNGKFSIGDSVNLNAGVQQTWSNLENTNSLAVRGGLVYNSQGATTTILNQTFTDGVLTDATSSTSNHGAGGIVLGVEGQTKVAQLGPVNVNLGANVNGGVVTDFNSVGVQANGNVFLEATAKVNENISAGVRVNQNVFDTAGGGGSTTPTVFIKGSF